MKTLPDGEPVALTHDGTTKIAPRLSPDGSRAVYTTWGTGWDSMSVPIGGGLPTLLMRNAAALTWAGANRVMFSETRDRTSLHMAVVSATENRGDPRDVYVPASPTGMAHYSELSPDGHSVLVVEMDTTPGWMPCRLAPSGLLWRNASRAAARVLHGDGVVAGWPLDVLRRRGGG